MADSSPHPTGSNGSRRRARTDNGGGGGSGGGGAVEAGLPENFQDLRGYGGSGTRPLTRVGVTDALKDPTRRWRRKDIGIVGLGGGRYVVPSFIAQFGDWVPELGTD